MCEPNHSFVQYPDQDDQGRPTEVMLQPSIGKKILEWGKKVLGWLHYSRLGGGHSEAIRVLGKHSYLIPEESRYEARWWDRTVILDGRFSGPEYDAKEALEASTRYAKLVSIGSLPVLRNFLEVSMRKTGSVRSYLDRFLEGLLNKEGRDHAVQKLKSALCVKNLYYTLGKCKESVEVAIKVMLGLTRKRHLLNSAWADDNDLWTPGQPQGMEGKPSLQLE